MCVCVCVSGGLFSPVQGSESPLVFGLIFTDSRVVAIFFCVGVCVCGSRELYVAVKLHRVSQTRLNLANGVPIG